MKRFVVIAFILTALMLAMFMPVPALADGDCNYHVIYMYGSKTYNVDTGNDIVKISDILQALELPGVVFSVQSFDETYVSVTAITNDWNLQVLKTFDEPKSISCTIEGQNIQIQVVSLPNSISVALYSAMYFDPAGGTGQYKTTFWGKEYINMENVQNNTTYTLPANPFTAPSNCTFAGWEIKGEQYAAGDVYFFTGSTTAKALWKDNATGEITNLATQYGITIDTGIRKISTIVEMNSDGVKKLLHGVVDQMKLNPTLTLK